MPCPVIHTKLAVPARRDDLVSRPRLLATLNDLVLHKKVVLVTAFAGYGKTVLLTDFARTTRLPVCWLTVDLLDEEPIRFVSHLIASIAQRFPAFGANSLAALARFECGLAAIDEVLSTVVNELHATIDQCFVLIVDDYHLVDSVPAVGILMCGLIEHAPANCRLLFSARRRLTLPNLALHVARARVGGLDSQELAFTAAEIQQFLQQVHALSVGETAVRAVTLACEGWITGLLLSTEPEFALLGGQTRLGRASGIELSDYFAQQIFDRQSPRMRTVLLRLAVFDQLNADRCDAVFGAAWLGDGITSQAAIENVVSQGLFVLPAADSAGKPHFQRQFRKFLCQRYRADDPAGFTNAMHALAAWHLTNEQWDEAIRLFRQIQDEAAVLSLLLRAGPKLLRTARTALLDQWFADLPPRLLGASPQLLGMRGMALVLDGQAVAGQHLLEQAAALSTGATPAERSQLLSWHAQSARLQGNYQAALADATAGLELLAGQTSAQQELHIELARERGVSECRQGRYADGMAHLQTVLARAATIGDEAAVAAINLDIATIHLWRGHGALAREPLMHALATWRRLDDQVQLANGLDTLGMLFRDHGDYTASLNTLGDAQRLAEHAESRQIASAIYVSLGELLLDLDCSCSADAAYRHSTELSSETAGGSVAFRRVLKQAWLASLNGEAPLADQYLEQAQAQLRGLTAPSDRGVYQLAAGSIYLWRKQNRPAIESLLHALSTFGECDQIGERFAALVYLALAYDADGARGDAAQALMEAAVLARNGDQCRRMLPGFLPFLERLASVSVTGAAADFQARLVDNLRALQQRLQRVRRTVYYHLPSDLAELCQTRATLKVHGFGRGEVIAGGKRLSNRDWQTTDARNLFFCLLAHPDGLTREEIGLFFWPDCSPVQMRSRFKNSIYRLRVATGIEVVDQTDGVYRIRAGSDYAYDVEEFTEQVAAGDRCPDPARRIAAYKTAGALYRGPFLPNVDAQWAQRERHHLRELYLDTLLKLAQIHLDGGAAVETLQVCQRILAEDACCERGHRLAMQAHAASGSRAAVARQYELCRRTLLDEIDAPPSAQTEALYLQLMA